MQARQGETLLDQTGAVSELITSIYQGDEELREAERQGQKDIAAKEQEVSSALQEQRYGTRERPLTVQNATTQKVDVLDNPPTQKGPSNGPLGGHTLSTPSILIEEDDTARMRMQSKKKREEEGVEEAKVRLEKSWKLTEQLAEKARRQALIEQEEQGARLERLREELNTLKRGQQAVKEKRAKFLREQKEIEGSSHFLPRFMIFNRSNVNVHLRLYSQPFHLVWCYANNVVPGSFATLTCPVAGFYKVEVSLATGKAS
nr:hypothetical protein B0A51_09453 [Rachicladosporium sp. CCFEE 5018]